MRDVHVRHQVREIAVAALSVRVLPAEIEYGAPLLGRDPARSRDFPTAPGLDARADAPFGPRASREAQERKEAGDGDSRPRMHGPDLADDGHTLREAQDPFAKVRPFNFF